MAQCPSCHQQVEIDSQFYGGLFTCPKCQSVYFIGFDGNPEQSTPHQTPVDNSVEPASSSYETPSNGSYENPGAASYEPQNNYSQPQEPQDYSANSESIQSTAENYQNLDQPIQSDNFYNDSLAPLDSTPQAPSNPLQEIVNFGNNEVVDTAFTYKLLIKGLDITQNVDELRDMLTDAKLGLNFNKLKSQIRNGELIIDKLDGAKAAIIAQRLRALPVEMVWEQKLYE